MVWSRTRAERVGSICPVTLTVTWALHALKYVNIASKSRVWALACSLPDGLPITYGTFPDSLCSYLETLWGTQSQWKCNPYAIADISWCHTDRMTIAKSQPEVEINCLLFRLSAAVSYIGAIGPFGLGHFFRPDGSIWGAWFCTVVVKDSHSTAKSDGAVVCLFNTLWRLNGPADVGAPRKWETGALRRPHYHIYIRISQRGR